MSAISPDEVRRAREHLYQVSPAEVAALAARRQVMQPAGPLLYAESEARLLHEQLSLVVLEAESGVLDLEPALPLLGLLLRRAAGRLAGWYLLGEAGALVERVAAALVDADPATRQALLRELTLYVGRLSYWLDLTIPWNNVNELMRAGEPAAG